MQTQILTFIVPIMAMIFATLFLALWWHRRERMYVLAYAACYGSIALGVAVNIWISKTIPPLGIVSYHLVSMAGVLALMWGLAKQHDRAIPLGGYALTVVLTSAFLWAGSANGQINAVKMAQNVNSALLIAFVAHNLWTWRVSHWADRALIWVTALFAGFGFVRPLLTEFSIILFGGGEQGAALLTAIHVLALATLLTAMAICLAATVITENIESERDKAGIDALSGLRTRGVFEGHAKEMLAKADAESVPVTMIVCDLDHFKKINDTWGHASGDRVIKSFGELLESKVRQSDIVGRVGGEEFCLLVWNCAVDGGARLAERIRAATHNIQGRAGEDAVPVTASLGVAEWRSGESYAQLFERADGALYQAKDAGRNRVVVDGLIEEDNDSDKVITLRPVVTAN